MRFSFLFLVGQIVTLRPRLRKDYLPGQQFKICGTVTKEGETSRIPSAFLVWHLEIVQIFLELILRQKASVAQISRLRLPFMQSPIIEHFQIFINDKWNDIIFQAFLEQNQSADTPVAILKRMDRFKFIMKRNQIFQRLAAALDDLEDRALAKRDPALFLQIHSLSIFIDEVQYAPELFSYIKIAIDNGAAPGSFWLTGSQTMPWRSTQLQRCV